MINMEDEYKRVVLESYHHSREEFFRMLDIIHNYTLPCTHCKNNKDSKCCNQEEPHD